VLAAFPTAAKEEMLSAFGPWCAETCIDDDEDKGEKSHQGFFGKTALSPGITWSNSTTALGLRGLAALDRIRSRCTGKERDTESGLDNFDFRYYSSSMGRFMKPDDAGADLNLNNPQSMNLYAYVRNNPLRYTDPTGHTCQTNSSDGTTYDDGDGKGCDIVDQQNKQAGPSVTVNGCEGAGAADCLAFMVSDLTSLQNVSEVGVKGETYAGLALGIGEIASAISGARAAGQLAAARALADTIPAGIPGLPAASRAALEAAANGGGETVTVVTNLTNAPAAGKALSVATGEGAEALAGAARSGGQTYTAQIPKPLITLLERSGLARSSVTDMGAGAAQEIRFAPQATQFVVGFFK
jgi:RHS repeat-associated protein